MPPPLLPSPRGENTHPHTLPLGGGLIYVPVYAAKHIKKLWILILVHPGKKLLIDTCVTFIWGKFFYWSGCYLSIFQVIFRLYLTCYTVRIFSQKISEMIWHLCPQWIIWGLDKSQKIFFICGNPMSESKKKLEYVDKS